MFILKLLKNLIRENTVKCTYILTIVGLHYFTLTLPSQSSYDVSYYTKFNLPTDTTYTVYIYESGSESGFASIKLKDSEHTVLGNKVVYKQTNPFVVVTTIIKYILLVILIISSIWGGDDGGWSYKDCLTDSYLKSVNLDVENSIYYYHLRGKLIFKSTQRALTSDLIGGVKNFIDNFLKNYKAKI